MKSALSLIVLQLFAAMRTSSGFATQSTLQIPRSIKHISLRANSQSARDDFDIQPSNALILSTAVAASIICSPLVSNAEALNQSCLDRSVAGGSNIISEQASNAEFEQPYRFDRDITLYRAAKPIECVSVASSSSVVASSISSPIGELEEGSETGIDPLFSKLGQWFLFLYIGVSLLAGGNEILKRIDKNRNQD